ncbi:MAG: cytochrome c [Candidatus Brocadiaceae bacterium]|nr:cytochrome c [Candidatus Brocadiaceae bacterium]
MKKITILISLVSILNILNLMHAPFVCADDNPFVTKQQTPSEDKHGTVILPIRHFTREMEHTVTQILEGILEGNFEYIKQEADHISKSTKKVIQTFFPQDNWYLKEKDLGSQERAELKKIFNSYVNLIERQAISLKEAADSQDVYKTLSAFVGMVKSTCIDCHTRYRE